MEERNKQKGKRIQSAKKHFPRKAHEREKKWLPLRLTSNHTSNGNCKWSTAMLMCLTLVSEAPSRANPLPRTGSMCVCAWWCSIVVVMDWDMGLNLA